FAVILCTREKQGVDMDGFVGFADALSEPSARPVRSAVRFEQPDEQDYETEAEPAVEGFAYTSGGFGRFNPLLAPLQDFFRHVERVSLALFTAQFYSKTLRGLIPFPDPGPYDLGKPVPFEFPRPPPSPPPPSPSPPPSSPPPSSPPPSSPPSPPPSSPPSPPPSSPPPSSPPPSSPPSPPPSSPPPPFPPPFPPPPASFIFNGTIEVVESQNVTLDLPVVPDGSVLTEVTETLVIFENELLESLGTDLDNLESIGANLEIADNAALETISTVNALESVGSSVILGGMDALTTIAGFNGIQTIGGTLSIDSNDNLTSITGFQSLKEVGAFLAIDDNEALSSITGFQSLETVDSFL
ncbi:MAG: hypothetical protein VXW31_03185, partial [Planctomycetota bacterium]|nr:hypothetical protein [Planctomycetota bacterium]